MEPAADATAILQVKVWLTGISPMVWRRVLGNPTKGHALLLRGASHPEELFATARLLGLPVLGIADRNTLAGIVRSHQRAEEAGVRMLTGCRLDLRGGPSLLVYPQDRAGYARLCRLLSLGKGRAGKGACDLTWQDVAVHAEGLLAVLVPDQIDELLPSRLARLHRDFGDRAYLALTLRRRPGDAVRLQALADAAAAARVATVATGDVLYHVPQRRILQDVMTCIREGCTIDDAGFRRARSVDCQLRPPQEMARLFARHPDAVARTLEIVQRCPFDLSSIPPEDKATYAMIRKADTLGTFQIESRTQMSMLPRLKPATFYDLVIEVAIVRPGPIQGDMVHPYLRRREGKDPVEYPTPELKRVLGKTLGVPLFQEQAMQVAIVCAGFTATEADALRRSMATFKVTGGVSKFQQKMIDGMIANGYEREFAERTFKQIEGFGSYGFPESHAASFALIAYASSWLKCHHPDVFCAALLNAQPMGFYAPAQIVRDAQLHGVEVRPFCINASAWDCTLEPADGRYLAVRLGLRMTKGLSETHAVQLVARRGTVAYRDVEDVWRRAGVPVSALERLAYADAFQGFAIARRNALWAIRGLDDTELPLMIAADPPPTPALPHEPPVVLPPMPAGGEVVSDYRSVGLTLRQHPVLQPGRRITLADIVLVRQRPGSAKGVMFATIEDETGHANIIIWPKVFERQRRIVLSASMIACRGLLQRESDVTHIVAEELTDLSRLLAGVGQRALPFPITHGRGDQVTHGGGPDSRKALGRKARDIYVPDIQTDALKVKTRDFR